MQFVSYNIQYCKGQDDQVSPERIAAEVHGADVIALQEVDRFWPHTGMIDQVETLVGHLPGYYWSYGPGVDIHVEGTTADNNRRRQFGNMILSRYPILRSRHLLLPKTGSVDALSIQRSVVEATIDCGETRVRVYSVHLCHLAAASRLPQVEQLLRIHRSAVHEGAPMCGDLSGIPYEAGIHDQAVPHHAILLGDFNCQPDSEEYDLLVGARSDYGGRVSPEDGFVDAWVAADNDRGEGATSDVNDAPATLDYCFISPALRDRVRSARVDADATGSDHLPLWIEIDL